MVVKQLSVAGATMYRETWEGVRVKKKIGSITVSTGGYNSILHLDNIDNAEMSAALERGEYDNLDNHQLADFYSHSNYVDIMLENGYNEDNIPTFDELDKSSGVYKTVISQIRTTNFNGKDEKADPNDPYDHELGYAYGKDDKKNQDLPIKPFGAKDDGHLVNGEVNVKFRAALETAQKAADKYWDKEINGTAKPGP